MQNDERLVLVGFGKNDLTEMLTWIGTDKEENLIKAWVKWPARYRPARICSQEEVKSCLEYLKYAINLVDEWENKV